MSNQVWRTLERKCDSKVLRIQSGVQVLVESSPGNEYFLSWSDDGGNSGGTRFTSETQQLQLQRSNKKHCVSPSPDLCANVFYQAFQQYHPKDTMYPGPAAPDSAPPALLWSNSHYTPGPQVLVAEPMLSNYQAMHVRDESHWIRSAGPSATYVHEGYLISNSRNPNDVEYTSHLSASEAF